MYLSRAGIMAAKISCHWLLVVISTVILTVHTLRGVCIHIQAMSGRLSLGEALECVLNDDYSSGEESNITEDPQFPLPVAFSDDESFTPPVSRRPGSPFVTTGANASITSMSTVATGSPTQSTSMSTVATGSPTQSAPPLSRSGRAAGKTSSMQNMYKLCIKIFMIILKYIHVYTYCNCYFYRH